MKEYKNIPQYASGIPKNCDSFVLATPSQSIKSSMEQKLGSAYALKFTS